MALNNGIDSPGAISRNQVNNRVSGKGADENPTDTSKQNYTEVGWSNDKGCIRLGHIAKQGDVTSGVKIETADAEHQLSLDLDGPRKGWTTSTSPAVFQVTCGDWPDDEDKDTSEARDSLMLTAKNGNINIVATNGKIKLQGTDIEFFAVGSDGKKGNIRMNATETIETNAKKTLINSAAFFKVATPGIGNIVANGVLQMYGSVFQGISDGCILKDSKTNLQKFAVANLVVGAVSGAGAATAAN